MPGRKRVDELEIGDLTQHAGGCSDPYEPFRVEDLVPFGKGLGIDVTWVHPPCGDVSVLGCSPGCEVEFFGRSGL